MHFTSKKAAENEAVVVSKIKESAKLILLLDLDNTILHCYMENKMNEEQERALKETFPNDIEIIQWRNFRGIIKFRPFLNDFLRSICDKYSIYVYTAGTVDYARGIIETVNRRFGSEVLNVNRMVGRSSEFENTVEKQIKTIFPSQSEMTVILDDNYHIWKDKNNLIHCFPYVFFNNRKEPPHPLITFSEGQAYLKSDFDFTLKCLTHVLNAIHRDYYAEGDRTVMEIIRKRRMGVLNDLEVDINGLEKIAFLASYEAGLIRYFNGSLGSYPKGVKLVEKGKGTSILWVQAIFMSWTNVPPELFKLEEIKETSQVDFLANEELMNGILEVTEKQYG